MGPVVVLVGVGSGLVPSPQGQGDAVLQQLHALAGNALPQAKEARGGLDGCADLQVLVLQGPQDFELEGVWEYGRVKFLLRRGCAWGLGSCGGQISDLQQCFDNARQRLSVP